MANQFCAGPSSDRAWCLWEYKQRHQLSPELGSCRNLVLTSLILGIPLGPLVQA